MTEQRSSSAREAGVSRPPGLAHHASRGVLVTLAGQWSRTALLLVSTIVLARLLVPADFGLVAMVTAVIGVADLVREFGLSGAIVREREIDERSWAALYRFSFLLGLGAMGATLVAAPLIAALYGDARLVPLTAALAPVVLLNAVAMPMQAALQRELRFTAIALSDALSMACGVGLAIAAASLGWGVWALVVLNASAALYRAAAMIVAVRPRLRNARPLRELLPVLRTGGSVFGVQLLNYAARNLDNVFIGRTLGASALGIYSRAYALLMLPISQLNGPLARVGLPVLSRLQDDPEGYRRYLRASMLVVSYAAIPVFAVAAAVADPLIAVVLGPRWDASAPIFALLAIAGIAQALGNVSGWLYISLGRAHRQLVYFLATKPIVIAAFPVGLWWNGVAGLALLYGLVSCALLVPGFMLAVRGTFVRPADVFGPVLRPVLLAAPMALAAWFGASSAGVGAPVALLLGIAGALAVAAVAALVFPAYRRDAQRIADLIARARRRTR